MDLSEAREEEGRNFLNAALLLSNEDGNIHRRGRSLGEAGGDAGDPLAVSVTPEASL